jgi:ribosomal protein S18 acetylase RimI-like enzyme
VKIRNATRDDLKNFVDVYRRAYEGLEEYAYKTSRDIKSYFRWLIGRDAGGLFVAEVKHPIGFVACDTNWFSPFENEEVGEIHELFVHPSWRKRKIGSALLGRGLDYARSRGRDAAELWVGVSNLKARRFYEKKGFREKECLGRWIRMVLKL